MSNYRDKPFSGHGQYAGVHHDEVSYDGSRSSEKHITGRTTDILLSFSIVTLPMLAFTALLLGLVYRY